MLLTQLLRTGTLKFRITLGLLPKYVSSLVLLPIFYLYFHPSSIPSTFCSHQERIEVSKDTPMSRVLRSPEVSSDHCTCSHSFEKELKEFIAMTCRHQYPGSCMEQSSPNVKKTAMCIPLPMPLDSHMIRGQTASRQWTSFQETIASVGYPHFELIDGVPYRENHTSLIIVVW